MKKLFVTVAAALLAGAALAQMPDVKIENHQGDVINTSSLVNGKPTILSFWSTTCKPCLMELNTINDQLMERLHRPLRQESGFQACDEREHGTACFRSGWGGKDCLQPYGLYSRFGSRTAGSDKGPSVKCDLRRGALSCLHCPAVVCCGIFFVSVKKISILCNKTAG